MISLLKKKIKFIIKSVFHNEIEKDLILKAKILSIKNKKKNKIKDLSEVEFKVFSQWGEDGIIDWIVNKFDKLPKIFLEIGTENYKESNTRFLLMNKNWNGFLIEAEKKNVKDIKSQQIYWKYNLKVENSFITKENINKIIKKLKVPKKIGLLSLDIDSNDYWILKQLNILDPYIIICEFNSLFGLKKSVTVPYKKNFVRTNEHYSNLYYGASIKAFTDLMIRKKYFLLGTNSAGNNAFFIKKNFFGKFNKFIIKKKIFRAKFRESRNKKGKLDFLDKKKSLETIKNKLLVDLKTGVKKKITDLNLLS